MLKTTASSLSPVQINQQAAKHTGKGACNWEELAWGTEVVRKKKNTEEVVEFCVR